MRCAASHPNSQLAFPFGFQLLAAHMLIASYAFPVGKRTPGLNHWRHATWQAQGPYQGLSRLHACGCAVRVSLRYARKTCAPARGSSPSPSSHAFRWCRDRSRSSVVRGSGSCRDRSRPPVVRGSGWMDRVSAGSLVWASHMPEESCWGCKSCY